MKKLLACLAIIVLFTGCSKAQSAAAPQANLSPLQKLSPEQKLSAESSKYSKEVLSGSSTLRTLEEEYTFSGENSEILAELLASLEYHPAKVCKCLPQYTLDATNGTSYGIHLAEGYARCEKGQADLTQEQIDQISEIIDWAKTENASH